MKINQKDKLIRLNSERKSKRKEELKQTKQF